MEETTPLINEQALTVGEYLSFLLPRLTGSAAAMPAWPADVFGIAASLLLRGGAYAAAMDSWPPQGRIKTWVTDTQRWGKEWRTAWGTQSFTHLDAAWATLLRHMHIPLEQIREERLLLDALVELVAVADEACFNVGITRDESDDGPETPEDEFYDLAKNILNHTGRASSSLCREIHSSRLKVLPKMHTPQNGLTLRSFSLNLALIDGDEIKPKWYTVPQFLSGDDQEEQLIRILVVPWPFKVEPADFRPASPVKHEMANMPDAFGFFEYEPTEAPDAIAYILNLLERLGAQGCEFDGIVLPELALSSSEYESLYVEIVAKRKFLLAGVRSSAEVDAHCKNEVRFGLPLIDPLRQAKHHRWQLNRRQIEQYGLSLLDKDRRWWEHISLSNREFMFVSLDKGLVVSVLICEDLARPDPVGNLLRSVGPNLVIALLMDGPQIVKRWPGRYAASLADDPGSSVLSVTSMPHASPP
jgi:hypothetical protein